MFRRPARFALSESSITFTCPGLTTLQVWGLSVPSIIFNCLRTFVRPMTPGTTDSSTMDLVSVSSTIMEGIPLCKHSFENFPAHPPIGPFRALGQDGRPVRLKHIHCDLVCVRSLPSLAVQYVEVNPRKRYAVDVQHVVRLKDSLVPYRVRYARRHGAVGVTRVQA